MIAFYAIINRKTGAILRYLYETRKLAHYSMHLILEERAKYYRIAQVTVREVKKKKSNARH